MPDGQRRPYSVWLSGEYPQGVRRAVQGALARHARDDPAWIAHEAAQAPQLRREQRRVHGAHARLGQERTYPSTIAYLAQLMIHRYAMLGILTEDGYPVGTPAS